MIYCYLCSSSWWVAVWRSHQGCLLALPPESWEALLGPVLDECLWYLRCNLLSANIYKKHNPVMVGSLGFLIFFSSSDWGSLTLLRAALTTCLCWKWLLAVAWQEGSLKELQARVNSHPIYQPFNHFGSSLIKHPINTVIIQGCILACAATASVANGNTRVQLYIHSDASRSRVISLYGFSPPPFCIHNVALKFKYWRFWKEECN